MENIIDNTFDLILLILCIAVVIGVFVMLIDRFLFKSRLSAKFHRKLKIEKTTNVITEIKKIAQLVCMSYYEEQLGIMEKREDGKFYFVQYDQSPDKEYDSLVVKYDGRLLAGVDLAKIKEKDIELSGNTLKAKIPHSEIFEIQINPDDKEFIYKSGDWGPDEENKLYCHMKETLVEHVIKENIFQNSDRIAINNLSTWFKSFGYEKVEVYMEQAEKA